jgi:hypothetical protein
MEKVQNIARLILGVLLVVFGLNYFLQFMTLPPMAEPANIFIGAIFKAGYILPIVAAVEILSGLALILTKYKALALVVVFPVLLNAFLFHLFLDLAGSGAAAFLFALNIFLIVRHKDAYAAILKPN